MSFIRTVRFGFCVSAIALALSACGSKVDSPTAALKLAEEAVAKGDFSAASVHLKNVLKEKPDDAQSRLALGKIYLAMGDFALAETDLRRALELKVDSKIVVPALFESIAMQGHNQKLVDEAAKVKSTDVELQALAHVYSGRGNFGLKKFDLSKADFAKALAIKPDSALAKIGNMTLSIMEAGDAKAIKGELNELLAKLPNSQELWAMSGFVARIEGRNADAKAALTKAIELKPYDIEQRAALVKTLIDLREFAPANEQILALLKVAPKNYIVSYLSALSSFRQNNYRDARENLVRVVEAAPEFQPALELAAETALQTNEFAMAERYSKSLIEKNPQNLNAHRLLAQTYLALNQPERALSVLQPLLQAKVTAPQILATVGEALIRTGDAKKGIEFLDAASKVAGDAPGLKAMAANAKIASGDAATGLQQLEQATIRSGSPTTDLTIAQGFANAKQFDKAASLITRFMKQQPKDPAGPHSLAMLALAQNKKEDAEKRFAEALLLNPGYTPTLDAWSALDLSAGKADIAKARYAAVIAKDPKNSSAILSLAALSARMGAPSADVLALYKQARDANPASTIASIEHSRYLIQNSQADEAIGLLEPLVQTNATDLMLSEALATAYEASGNVGKAIQTLEKQLQGNAFSSALNYRVGSLRLRLQDFPGAMKSFQQAADLQPNSVEPKVMMATTLFNSGKKSEALSAAQAIVASAPKSPVGYLLVGDFMGAGGKNADAVTQYKQAYALAQTTAPAFKLYQGLHINGNVAEAAQFLRTHWNANPKDIDFMLQASEVLLSRKDFKETVAVLSQVFKVDKDNPAALNNAAVAMHQLKEARAIELAQRAYQIEPNNYAIQDTYGLIALEQGKLTEALPLLKSAAAKAPRNAEIRLHYAQALSKKGDVAGAREEAKQALQNNPDPEIKAAAELLVK
jgi:cellulose synthase operon protein C